MPGCDRGIGEDFARHFYAPFEIIERAIALPIAHFFVFGVPQELCVGWQEPLYVRAVQKFPHGQDVVFHDHEVWPISAHIAREGWGVFVYLSEERVCGLRAVNRCLGGKVSVNFFDYANAVGVGFEDFEFETRGFADQALGAFDVLHTRQFDHDAPIAFAVNDGFRDAKLVDAIADNFEGARDHVCFFIV